MSKVMINSLVFSNLGKRQEIITKAVKNQNKVYFSDEDDNFVIELLPRRVILNKKDQEKTMMLVFEQGQRLSGTLRFNEPGITLELETHTKELTMNDGGIKILYELKIGGEYSDTFTYQLKWEDNDEHYKKC